MKKTILAATSLLALGASPALAQDAAGDRSAAAESQDETGAQDPVIVVVGTAGAGTTRQDAAFAVTALSDEAIARAAPASTADILNWSRASPRRHRAARTARTSSCAAIRLAAMRCS